MISQATLPFCLKSVSFESSGFFSCAPIVLSGYYLSGWALPQAASSENGPALFFLRPCKAFLSLTEEQGLQTDDVSLQAPEVCSTSIVTSPPTPGGLSTFHVGIIPLTL